MHFSVPTFNMVWLNGPFQTHVPFLNITVIRTLSFDFRKKYLFFFFNYIELINFTQFEKIHNVILSWHTIVKIFSNTQLYDFLMRK